ncbi:MAG: hypothetical protein RQ733_05465 [Methyloprofundus sp.]|nr:hypothetical protein [Methyloprofundus sp.]MDT8425403.1 hypothetical protein [Methyloprofundus sp.]
MSAHSKELLQGIHQLNKLNLNTCSPFQALTQRLIEQQKHAKDEQITALINAINLKFALSEKDLQAYRKSPLTYMGKATTIGINNAHGHTYRVIRAEHYPEFPLLCNRF